MTRAAYRWHAPKTTVAGLRGHEPYDSARKRYEQRDDLQTVPAEIEDIILAEALGLRLQELRETPWEDVERLMAYRRGVAMAAHSKPPGEQEA